MGRAVIETERLRLRAWRGSDAEACFVYAKDPDVGPICGWPPHKDVEESRTIIATVLSQAECYAVCLKETDEPIGCIELRLAPRTDMTDRNDECELGFWLGKPHWGQGYMPEAIRAMLGRAFEDLGMRCVWCGYYDGNERSRRVQEKCGFVYCRTTKNLYVPLLNETRVGHVNCLTKEAWLRQSPILRHKGTRRLETERLVLRPFTVEDAAPAFRNWTHDADIVKFLTWPLHADLSVTERLMERSVTGYADAAYYQWAIELRSLGEPIGSLGVGSVDEKTGAFEIGYCIGKAWWHRGFVSEALASVIDYLFAEVGARRVMAKHAVDNPHSGDVMRKCGMTYEGTLRRAGWCNSGVCDFNVYSILREEWEARRGGEIASTAPAAPQHELWDAYDAESRKIEGVTLVRGEPIPDGLYHLVSDVLVRHVDGEILLMQRDFSKHFGGLWEATSGGSALKGETPEACALRELLEETGIVAQDLIRVGVEINRERHTLYYEYMCRTDCAKDSVRLQAGETVAYRWVTEAELRAMRSEQLLTKRMFGYVETL